MALTVAFLHPDLGLGGAERLVVDAATGLAELGHRVTIYTSHYEAKRAFAETRSGAFAVVSHGDWLPTTFLGAFHIVAALLRNAYLAMVVALRATDADVFVCDQVSICVPILRLLRPRCGILFYCHFPDMLLSKRTSLLKALYRKPFDSLEEACTGLADTVVVNSKFTRGVYRDTFTTIQAEPAVLYPCISVPEPALSAAQPQPQEEPLIFLSINRYERKKGIEVAVRAFAKVLASVNGGSSGKSGGGRATTSSSSHRLHLVIAGGYDERVTENIEHHKELVAVAREVGLIGPQLETSASAIARVLTRWPGLTGAAAGGGSDVPYDRVQVGEHITFIRSFTDEQKSALLGMACAVVYTPMHEHFGIVPLECMAARRPVIACASGGPLESVLDGKTGFLCQPTPESFATAMATIATDPGRAGRMGAAGHTHVASSFTRPVFAAQLELMCTNIAASSGKRPARTFAGVWRHWLTLLVLAMLAVAVGVGGWKGAAMSVPRLQALLVQLGERR